MLRLGKVSRVSAFLQDSFESEAGGGPLFWPGGEFGSRFLRPEGKDMALVVGRCRHVLSAYARYVYTYVYIYI